VGVEDQQGAEDRVHDGVQGAGSEGSDSQRDQSDRDESRSASASIVLIYTLHLGLHRPSSTGVRTSQMSSGSYPPKGEAWE
jgi:hypothetical protein